MVKSGGSSERKYQGPGLGARRTRVLRVVALQSLAVYDSRMIITLHGERPLSWNTLYSGGHWGRRKLEADRVHLAVKMQVDESCPDVEPFDSRVHITIRAYFKSRPLDPCNITAKIYIDGLHGIIIHDDTMEHVAGVTTMSFVDKENPRVEIEVVPEVQDESKA